MTRPGPPPARRAWLTPRGVAQALRVSSMTVYRLIETCEITPVVRVGRQYRIHRTTLAEYLRQAEVGT